MRIESNSSNRDSWHGNRVAGKTKYNQQYTGEIKQPARAIDEKESQCSPPVTIGLQMSGTTVSMEGDGDLGYPFTIQTRFDDHLGRKFHPCASQVQPMIQILRESA